jgi:TonB-dependent SusC/RagA subfamily outer membrane receptor
MRILCIMSIIVGSVASKARAGESASLAHLIAITGTITDDVSQQPLAGVSIVVKGTSRGTSTDTDGRYTLEVDASETLIISFIGFKTTEILVGQRTIVDVVLEADTSTPRDTQVIGTNYFSTTREKSTMNIAKIEGAEIAHQPVTSLMNALVARVPGVDVTPVNGVAGIAPNLIIRGNNSLRPEGDTYPLYIIDGVQIESQPVPAYASALFAPGFDPLGAINPADIESIEVLKDAAATTIYGARGANGVIKITTKRGSTATKSGLELSAYTGVGQVSRQMDLLNDRQYMTMRREAFRNSGTTPGLFDYDLTTWDTTRYTDFQKALLGNTARITDIRSHLRWKRPHRHTRARRISQGRRHLPW